MGKGGFVEWGGRLTDSGELGEDLDEGSEHESFSPLGHFEHDAPALVRDGLFGADGRSDLSVLFHYEFLVVSHGVIRVEFSQDYQGFFVSVLFDEPAL